MLAFPPKPRADGDWPASRDPAGPILPTDPGLVILGSTVLLQDVISLLHSDFDPRSGRAWTRCSVARRSCARWLGACTARSRAAHIAASHSCWWSHISGPASCSSHQRGTWRCLRPRSPLGPIPTCRRRQKLRYSRVSRLHGECLDLSSRHARCRGRQQALGSDPTHTPPELVQVAAWGPREYKAPICALLVRRDELGEVGVLQAPPYGLEGARLRLEEVLDFFVRGSVQAQFLDCNLTDWHRAVGNLDIVHQLLPKLRRGVSGLECFLTG